MLLFIELAQEGCSLGDPVVGVFVGRELDRDNKIGGVTWNGAS